MNAGGIAAMVDYVQEARGNARTSAAEDVPLGGLRGLRRAFGDFFLLVGEGDFPKIQHSEGQHGRTNKGPQEAMWGTAGGGQLYPQPRIARHHGPRRVLGCGVVAVAGSTSRRHPVRTQDMVFHVGELVSEPLSAKEDMIQPFDFQTNV